MIKRRLYLVGAGSFGRELRWWIDFSSAKWEGFEFSGFIDDVSDPLKDYPEYAPGVVATTVDFEPDPGDALVMAIADPRAKLETAQRLTKKGGRFISFVHHSVILSNHVRLGDGVVICPNAVVSCHAEIGDFGALNLGVTIGHDVKLGAGCTLSAHADVTGHVVLEEGVFLGSHASILPHARVGAFARVGAGTVVLRSVKAGATVMGVPAKQILP